MSVDDGRTSIASSLYEPVTIRDLTVRNRLVVSPMCQYSSTDGRVGDYHLVHLGRFAMGGFGLVMVESTAVTPEGRITYADLGLWDDIQVGPVRRLVDFVHSCGAAVGVQLGHAGPKAATMPPWAEDLQPPPDGEWETVSSTPHPVADGLRPPRELSEGEIAELVQRYADAAARADAAGVDVLEIHMAHGYLLHVFLSPLSNTRTDRYGGDLQGRARMPLEVVRAVRAAWPDGKPLFVRLSVVDNPVDENRLEESVQLAKTLASLGVDVVDCSSGGVGGRYEHVLEPGYQVEWAARIKAEAGVATMAVGLVTDARQAENVVVSGAADLVAMGREALIDPSWPLRVRHELEPQRAANYDLAVVQSRGWLTQRHRLLNADRDAERRLDA